MTYSCTLWKLQQLPNHGYSRRIATQIMSKCRFIEDSRSGTVKTSSYWLQPFGCKLFTALLKSLEGHVLSTILNHVAAFFYFKCQSISLCSKKSFPLLFTSFNRNSENEMCVSIDCHLKYLCLSDVFQLNHFICLVQFVMYNSSRSNPVLTPN